MTTSPTTLRCALIGADTLLIECARILRERGHEIVSVAAGSARVAEWCSQAEIPAYDADAVEAWADDLREHSVDYIFAITHLHLLPSSVITAANRIAINFHDGPLPEYAGLNTPVWGILRGETDWGVSWHRIDDGIDSGEVLVQRRFAIAERETSLSLNTRNFEEALDSFAEVLDLLESDRISATPREGHVPLAMFRRADRPDGVLDFNQPAAAVDRVVRALHFGPHPNPVAAAVLWHPLAAVIVGSTDIVAVSQGVAVSQSVAPGTLLAADTDGLTVACADSRIRLGELCWLDGVRCDVQEFLLATGAKVGEPLPQLTSDQRAWLAEFAAKNQRHETSTMAAISALTPADFPWPHRPTHSAPTARATVNVPLAAAAEPARMVSALAVLLRRLTPEGGFDVALAREPVPDFARTLICSEVAFNLSSDLTADRASSWHRDLIARTPRFSGRPELANGLGLQIGVRLSPENSLLPHAIVVLQPSEADGGWELDFATPTIDERDAAEFARCLAVTAAAFDSEGAPSAVPLLAAEVHQLVVHQWNSTDVAYESACIHDLIARQVAATPHRQAVICGDDAVTYEELAARSNRLAAHLQKAGVGPESLVAVHVDRSIDLVVAVLGVLQAGGAYVPLDPSYPSDRLRHMIADSGTRVIVCQHKDRDRLPLPADDVDRSIVAVDGAFEDTGMSLQSMVQPNNLAYCIYTSGSSGTPKGVLLEHRNVANFFTAMDAVIDRTADDTWCAVTSLSFDISVLELLYTLARGIRIALYAPDTHNVIAPRKAMDFSLFYFSADEADDANDPVGGKYRLLLDGARFADANGFRAVWTPERHFHAFGGLYPNPSVTAAAIATITERVEIRAGSVVLPLHHPAEVAEAWSMVDNLSHGRVGVAFASGWQPNDFILRPQNYATAKQTMFESIEQIRRLWHGDELPFEGPNGMTVQVTTLPRPIQAELPMWITTAGNPDSFSAAGAIGANLLTHLVGQSIDQLAAKIAAYRKARTAAGHDPNAGVVTLMLHTFLSDDDASVRAAVREPLRNYLNTSVNLLREHAWSFPTFRRPDGAAISQPNDLGDDDFATMAKDDLDAVLDFAAERYYETSGLFGTPDQVLPLIDRLHEIGVDEIACLIDFGVATETVLANLPHLARLRQLVAANPTVYDAVDEEVADDVANDVVNDRSIAELVISSATTHLQCTPSMARMFTLDPAMRKALGEVQYLFVGGEALPTDLASELQSLVSKTVTNMYGPTETTVWSSTWQVQPGFDWTPIGTPIANTQFYVLDTAGQPTPIGVAGQLWIGGAGVARGYHHRPELTAERFVADPYRENGRMYWTGDLARWHAQPDGGAILEFLGRSDQQVKFRGHRIELGEIEAELRRVADVVDCAAVVRERVDDRFDQQLVAYVVVAHPTTFDTKAVRELLRQHLPEVMVPGHVVVLPALPRTPNGKLDRRALPATVTPALKAQPTPASSDVEHQVLAGWCQILGIDVSKGETLGIDDNFFDAGGHSLLVVRLHRFLQEMLGRNIALTDLYRFPTVRTFTASLTNGHDSSTTIDAALDRAARRRATARGKS